MKHNPLPIGIIHEKGFRPYQEDAYGYLYVKPYWVFVVADGMGGMDKGDLASKIAVHQIIQAFEKSSGIHQEQELIKLLREAIIQALNGIRHLVSKDEVAASTLILAVWNPEVNTLWITWAGDSRIYLTLGPGEDAKPNPGGPNQSMCVAMDNSFRLYSLTEDHSLVWTFFQKGEMSFDDLKNHPYRSKVTLSLSSNITINDLLKHLRVKKFKLNIQEHASLLLCTDGIWESIGNSFQLLNIIKTNTANPEKLASEIRQAVKKNQGKVEEGDNYTAIVTNLALLSRLQTSQAKKISAPTPPKPAQSYRIKKRIPSWKKFFPLIFAGAFVFILSLFFVKKIIRPKTESYSLLNSSLSSTVQLHSSGEIQQFFKGKGDRLALIALSPARKELGQTLEKFFAGCTRLTSFNGTVVLIRTHIGSSIYFFLHDLGSGKRICRKRKSLSTHNNIPPKTQQDKKTKKEPAVPAHSKTPLPQKPAGHSTAATSRKEDSLNKQNSQVVAPQKIGQKEKKKK